MKDETRNSKCKNEKNNPMKILLGRSIMLILSLGLLYSCENIRKQADEKLNQLNNKTKELDSLVNKETKKILALDSIINSEMEKVKALDSIVDKSSSTIDSIVRDKGKMLDNLLN